jgi:CelD/BcsL family acetyltransferase involved in cellulose biosynthesis
VHHFDVIDPLSDPRWARFVQGSARASIFHHPAWLALLHDQYGYHVMAWCVVGDAGEIVAGLPLARVSSRLTGKRLVALPFSDLCPPVVADGDASDALKDGIEAERARHDLKLQIRGDLPGLSLGSTSQWFHHHLLPLAADPVEVERRFAKSYVSRGVAKAVRLGLTVERRVDVDALDLFYALHLETRHRQGMPTQPKEFIRRFASLFAQDLGFVLLVRSEGRPAAAAVFLAFNRTLTYKYGASDAGQLDKRPNNLLFMEAIRWGCAQRFHTLDLGRTERDNAGLRAFKLAWGAEERALEYTVVPPSQSRTSTGPPRAMRATIRRAPRFVGRMVGEAMYRHFG